MTYASIAAIQGSYSLRQRLTACAAEEKAAPHPYSSWVDENMWDFAAQPGWAAAWEYALAAHPDDPEFDPGAHSDVITDGMILAAVQTLAPQPD